VRRQPVRGGQNGRQARLTAADFAFYDTRRPYEVIMGTDRERPTRVMTFMFSPSLLPLSPDRLGRLTATRIRATAGMGDLTSQFLLHLARNIDHYSPSEAARLSTAALEVLATRLAHELDVPDWGRRSPAGTPCSPPSRPSSSSAWVTPACHRP
jgi:hypothetical protein